MRVRLRMRPAVLFGLMLLIALIAVIPMRLALGVLGVDRAGVTARSAIGPVWFATLRELHVGGLDLGDVHAFLSPLDLIVGRARISIEGPRPVSGPQLRAALLVSRHSFGVEGASGIVPAAGAFGPLPLSRLEFTEVAARFASGQCTAAQGQVRAELAGGMGEIALPPSLSGAIRCEGDALVLPLRSGSGNEGLTLRVRGDGRYRGELLVAPGDAASVERLTAHGFLPGADGYRLSVEGRF